MVNGYEYITLRNYPKLFSWKNQGAEQEYWEQKEETLEAEMRWFRENYFLRCEWTRNVKDN